LSVLTNFWKDFDQQINEKKDLDRSKITQKSIDEDCPKCGKSLLSKLGRRGNFIACSGYPDCDFTRSLNGDLPQEPKVIAIDKETKKNILLLIGPYGPYLQLGEQEENNKIVQRNYEKDNIELSSCNNKEDFHDEDVKNE